jgi:hypothetical protein
VEFAAVVMAAMTVLELYLLTCLAFAVLDAANSRGEAGKYAAIYLLWPLFALWALAWRLLKR